MDLLWRRHATSTRDGCDWSVIISSVWPTSPQEGHITGSNWLDVFLEMHVAVLRRPLVSLRAEDTHLQTLYFQWLDFVLLRLITPILKQEKEFLNQLHNHSLQSCNKGFILALKVGCYVFVTPLTSHLSFFYFIQLIFFPFTCGVFLLSSRRIIFFLMLDLRWGQISLESIFKI